MNVTNAEIRNRARQCLLGHYGPVVCAVLLTEVIGWLCAVTFTFSTRSIPALLVSCVISGILTVLFHVLRGGFDFMFLQLARQRQIRMSDVFYCFRMHTDTSIRLGALLFAVNLAAALPFVLADYFLLSAPSASVPGRSGSFWPGLILRLLYLVVMAVLNLVYSLSFLLLIDDPSQKPLSVMRRSRGLTLGAFPRLLLLFLSFAGYVLLAIVSFGLGFLWVYPYMGASKAHFYLTAKENAE